MGCDSQFDSRDYLQATGLVKDKGPRVDTTRLDTTRLHYPAGVVNIIPVGDPAAQPGPYGECMENENKDKEKSLEDRPELTYFERELKHLINKFSVESKSNTPDFILAEYLQGCLNAFGNATIQREKWYGRKVF